jgi:hypothetical protein
MRELAIGREVEPFVGFVPSMVLCGVGVALAFLFSARLPLPDHGAHPFLVPTALSTLWSGLLLAVSRTKARHVWVRNPAPAVVFGLLPTSCRSWSRPEAADLRRLR